MDKNDALSRIAAAVGPQGIVAAADAEGLLVDERRRYRGRAALIVKPASTAECAEVIRICAATGLRVVPQGGNTGYCGGATPFDADGEVLLCTARLNRIRELDPVGFTMTVEAGVVLADAQRAAAEEGLLFPLSLGAEGSCQIGGNLSTNAGGIAVLRYGTMRDLVLGLEVVLPSGELLSELKALRKDNTGYDLKSLFLGAEGTLGLITGAVLKLFPAPRVRQTAWLAVASPEAACRLLARARRESADQVVSAEYLSRRSLDLVLAEVEGARDPLDSPYPHYLLLEFASADEESVLREKVERVLTAGLDAGEIEDGAIAESEAQRRSLWLLRERMPEAEVRAGGSIKHDISLRISRIAQFLERVEPALAEIGRCQVSVYGHIGDGNLHFNLRPPSGESIDAFRSGAAARLSRRVYDLVAELDGSFSAEHGVGILKKSELERYESAEGLAVMRILKQALDPHGIMNPGKVVAADSQGSCPKGVSG